MTANQPTIEERLSRLETLFVNVGEKVAEHDETIKQHDNNIDVLVANIQELKETVKNLTEETPRMKNNYVRMNYELRIFNVFGMC